ncbi:metallophosphoesterase [Telmatocola sphagniphila]|uniref:Metallophosphoesterase n=1 Tax=Telmatocola sphagniphila TaxID=1123043 RepID=A0A8E6EUD4_9BACT|nr:metallophosphoesterase [Telmatocola sphagniphila]QVL31117.1 metallophosphoesterase [Telmatocola sphagniphila]
MLDILMFLLAWLGHACFMMVLLNMAYSMPWDRNFRKVFRLLMGLWIFLGPLYYYYLFGQINPLNTHARGTVLILAHALYMGISFTFAIVALPLITIVRLRRKPPKNLLRETTEVLDVEQVLGHKPVGDGKYHFLADLPFNMLFKVDFTTLRIGIPNLPAEWEGLTILHLSDMHFIGTPGKEYFDAIVEKCLEYGPHDLVVISGDIIDTNKHIAWIEPILGRLKGTHGTYAILGNHDWWQDSDAVRSKLRELNITVLGNNWETVKIKGQPMTIIGNEQPWFHPGPDLFAAPSGVFKLLISHTPDYVYWAASKGVQLMLSGHNHGGQLRLPIFGSIFVPSWYSRRFDMGTFAVKGTMLHVNRGMGSKEPLRFLCNPQVSRILLERI